MTTGSRLRAGAPLPRLQWYKDAVPLSQLQDPRYRLLPGGLRIEQLRPHDSGIFQCFASNEGGEVQTSTYLDVTSEYQPAEARHPPRGVPSARPLGDMGGEWCQVTAAPSPGVTSADAWAQTGGCPRGPPCSRQVAGTQPEAPAPGSRKLVFLDLK